MPGPIWLTNKTTNQDEPFEPGDVTAALQTGRYLDPGAIATNRAGVDVTSRTDVAQQDQLVAPVVDPNKAAVERGQGIRAARNAGVGATARAAAGGAVSGATAGLLNPWEEEQEFHPIASGAGQVVGIVAPALLGDEAGVAGAAAKFLPSGLIGRAGAGVAERLGGGLIATGAAGATEGALFGAGQAAHEIAFSDDPVSLQQAASSIGSNVLYGAGFGAGAGVIGHGLAAGLSKAKQGVDAALSGVGDAAARDDAAFLAKRGDPEAFQGPAEQYGPQAPEGLPAPLRAPEEGTAGLTKGVRPATPDNPFGRAVPPSQYVDYLATLDKKGLDLERRAALDEIEADRVPQREQFVADIEAQREQAKQLKLWEIAGERDPRGLAENRARSEATKLTLAADKRLDYALRVRGDLVENPGKLISVLRQQDEALEKLEKWSTERAYSFVREVDLAPRRIKQQLLDNEIPGWKFGPGGLSPDSPLMNQAIEGEMYKRYGGLTFRDATKRPAVFDAEGNLRSSDVTQLRDENKSMRDRLETLISTPESSALQAIEEARDALASAPKGRETAPKPAPAAEPEPTSSLGATILHGAASLVGGPVGAIAAAGGSVLGGLRSAIKGAASRTGRALSDFLDTGSRVVTKSAPLASRVLQQVSYAPAGTVTGDVAKAANFIPPTSYAQSQSLPQLFSQRAAEIKSQVQIAPDGSFQMTAAARAAVAAKLDGLRAIDPIGADRLETLAARRLEFLASILPRQLDIGGVQIGPTRYRPTELAIRSFARSANAVEDPTDVFERAANGRVMPEDAAALRAVYPDLLQDFTNRVAQQLPHLRTTLPYARRLSLSILTGVAVDAAMTPLVLGQLQAMHAAEPGSQGGTQAPRAQPAFGSIKAPQGTETEQRQENA